MKIENFTPLSKTSPRGLWAIWTHKRCLKNKKSSSPGLCWKTGKHWFWTLPKREVQLKATRYVSVLRPRNVVLKLPNESFGNAVSYPQITKPSPDGCTAAESRCVQNLPKVRLPIAKQIRDSVLLDAAGTKPFSKSFTQRSLHSRDLSEVDLVCFILGELSWKYNVGFNGDVYTCSYCGNTPPYPPPPPNENFPQTKELPTVRSGTSTRHFVEAINLRACTRSDQIGALNGWQKNLFHNHVTSLHTEPSA